MALSKNARLFFYGNGALCSITPYFSLVMTLPFTTEHQRKQQKLSAGRSRRRRKDAVPCRTLFLTISFKPSNWTFEDVTWQQTVLSAAKKLAPILL